jgi:hypothetical protein
MCVTRNNGIAPGFAVYHCTLRCMVCTAYCPIALGISVLTIIVLAVSVAAPSKARTVFDRSNSGIVCSNPAPGMDVCPRFSVLCCSV